jgi:hypothetical protein
MTNLYHAGGETETSGHSVCMGPLFLTKEASLGDTKEKGPAKLARPLFRFNIRCITEGRR